MRSKDTGKKKHEITKDSEAISKTEHFVIIITIIIIIRNGDKTGSKPT